MGGFDSSIDWTHKYGLNAVIDTNTDPEDVWSAGGVYTFPAAAGTLSIVSASVEDDADKDPAGTGAFTIVVQGLDANGMLQSETVTMDGATPVVPTSTWLRVFRAYVVTVGSGGTNAGVITITHSDGPSTVLEIPTTPTEGQTQMAVYTVPADYSRAFVTSWVAGLSDANINTVAVLRLDTRANGEGWRTQAILSVNQAGGLTGRNDWPGEAFAVAPLTDIRVRCQSVTSNGTGVWSAFDVAQLRY